MEQNSWNWCGILLALINELTLTIFRRSKWVNPFETEVPFWDSLPGVIVDFFSVLNRVTRLRLHVRFGISY